MKRRPMLGVTLAGVIAFGIAGHAWGQEQSAQPPGGRAGLAITKFYSDSPSNVGDFPGRLVRLSCGESATATFTPRCAHTDYALLIDGDEGVHPLLPGTEAVRTELDSPTLQQADVQVHGKYYPSTGAILVSRIALRCKQSPC